MSDDKKVPEKFPRKQVLPDGTVFTAYGVRATSAPPPIKPMGNSATLRKKPAPTTHKPAVPVDWSFWPASRRVKPDEAIALSLNLDPHSLYSSTDGHINPEFCPDNATAILFLKRLNLLSACDRRTNIPLSEIAAWAVSISLAPIPPKFEEIVNATKSNKARERAVDKVTDAIMERNKPIETTVYIVQAAAPHAPAAPTATKTDGNGAPEEVGAGDTALQGTGEPPMRVGSNPAKAYKLWIVWQAENLKQQDDNFATLSQRIVDLANERKYRNQGGNEFTLGTVTRSISETKITGGRSKNGRKSSKINLARQTKLTPNQSAKSTKARKPL